MEGVCGEIEKRKMDEGRFRVGEWAAAARKKKQKMKGRVATLDEDLFLVATAVVESVEKL